MCLAPIGIDLVEALVERVVMYLLDPSAHGKAAHSSWERQRRRARVAAGRGRVNEPRERPTWSQLRSRDSCSRLLVQADTCPTAARDGVMGRKAGHAALLGGVARFCGPHMMPEPMHRTGAVCHAAEHFNEARDAPFGAAPPQPPATQPCRWWARPRPVRPSLGLLQPPLQARRPAWPPWACGGVGASAPMREVFLEES